MASTVQAELNKGNPVNFADLNQLAKIGDGLALMPRTEKVTVTANIGTLSRPAAAILWAYATVATSAGNKTVLVKETAAGSLAAGQCTVDEDGNILFEATDAVTAALVVYVPVEGALYSSEVVPVTAAGVATLADSREAIQLTAAALNTGGGVATPGAKVILARGNAAPGAGNASLAAAGTSVQFDATEAGTGGTATISYYAVPGEGSGPDDPFGDRLEASFDVG